MNDCQIKLEDIIDVRIEKCIRKLVCCPYMFQIGLSDKDDVELIKERLAEKESQIEKLKNTIEKQRKYIKHLFNEDSTLNGGGK